MQGCLGNRRDQPSAVPGESASSDEAGQEDRDDHGQGGSRQVDLTARQRMRNHCARAAGETGHQAL